MTVILAMASALGMLIGYSLAASVLVAVTVIHPLLAWTFVAIIIAGKLWPA